MSSELGYVMQVIKSDFTTRGIAVDPLTDNKGEKYLLLTFNNGSQVILCGIPVQNLFQAPNLPKQTRPRWSE